MKIFDVQRDIISGLKAQIEADTTYTGYNVYANEVVFLQPYELPAILIYTFKNYPTAERLRDNLDNHERNMDLRFEIRGSSDVVVDYEAIADNLFDSCLIYKKYDRTITQVGNPTYQFGLDQNQPGEVAATLDVPIFYFSRKNR